jgi:hypothetical protein
VDSVYNSGLLIVLPRLETANIKGLDQVGLIRREFDNLDMVHPSLKDEVRSLIASSSINQEYMLGFIRPAIIVLNEMV